MEVLLIHRPRYDDWSFPQGRPNAGKVWPEIVHHRELYEETGLPPRLEGHLPTIRYGVKDGTKNLHY